MGESSGASAVQETLVAGDTWRLVKVNPPGMSPSPK